MARRTEAVATTGVVLGIILPLVGLGALEVTRVRGEGCADACPVEARFIDTRVGVHDIGWSSDI